MTYKGYIRTTLSCDERKVLKRQASQKGMTLTGYIDALLRNDIKGKRHDTLTNNERSS